MTRIAPILLMLICWLMAGCTLVNPFNRNHPRKMTGSYSGQMTEIWIGRITTSDSAGNMIQILDTVENTADIQVEVLLLEEEDGQPMQMAVKRVPNIANAWPDFTMDVEDDLGASTCYRRNEDRGGIVRDTARVCFDRAENQLSIQAYFKDTYNYPTPSWTYRFQGVKD